MPDGAIDVDARVSRFLVALDELVKNVGTDDSDPANWVRDVLEAVHAFYADSTDPLAIVLEPGTVFFSGRPLHAPRWVHEIGDRLAEALARDGWCGVEVDPPVEAAEVEAFAGGLGARWSRPGEPWPARPMRHIHLDRKLESPEDETPTEAKSLIYEAYATAITAVRACSEGRAPSRRPEMRTLKRAAQKLADLVIAYPLLRFEPISRRIAGDHTVRAVDSALLAAAILSHLTDDRDTLREAAMTALILGIGSVQRSLSLPPSATAASKQQTAGRLASAILRIPGANREGRERMALAVETQWMRRMQLRPDELYGGCGPSMVGRVVALCLRFHDTLPGRPMPLRSAIAKSVTILQHETKDTQSGALMCLLLGTIGWLPRGLVVELSTGEIGTVVSSVRLEPGAGLPRVEILMDGEGELLNPTFEIDLDADPSPHMPSRTIVGIVDTSMSNPEELVSRLRSGTALAEMERSSARPGEPSSRGQG